MVTWGGRSADESCMEIAVNFIVGLTGWQMKFDSSLYISVYVYGSMFLYQRHQYMSQLIAKL